MASLVIFGANGFVGRALIDRGQLPLTIKAVARKVSMPLMSGTKAVRWYFGDLTNPSSLDSILGRDDVVINLAYNSNADLSDNLRIIDCLIDACLRHRVSRLIHCSTAVVVGRSRETVIDESISCKPKTSYEQTKFALEKRVLCALEKGLDVGILRPTAIVGPGGQNLVKLATSLKHSSHIVNYLRASAFGRRPMHLVPVDNVVDALLHLAKLSKSLGGRIYIISSDEDDENNFRSVEKCLMYSMNITPRKFPLLPVPSFLLSSVLWLLGRSEWNLVRSYSSNNLKSTGFVGKDSVLNAVSAFGHGICGKHRQS